MSVEIPGPAGGSGDGPVAAKRMSTLRGLLGRAAFGPTPHLVALPGRGTASAVRLAWEEGASPSLLATIILASPEFQQQ